MGGGGEGQQLRVPILGNIMRPKAECNGEHVRRGGVEYRPKVYSFEAEGRELSQTCGNQSVQSVS